VFLLDLKVLEPNVQACSFSHKPAYLFLFRMALMHIHVNSNQLSLFLKNCYF